METHRGPARCSRLLCFKYIERCEVDTNWGITVESHHYLECCRIVLKYQAMTTQHAKIATPARALHR